MQATERIHMWQRVVYAHELNVEDFGRNIMEEPERFYAARDSLRLGFKYFQKRDGESSREDYLVQKKKMYQVRDDLQSIREKIFDIAYELENQEIGE